MSISPPPRHHGAPARSASAAVHGIVEQDFRTIAPYTIEEAYEVADAIERNDLPALRDELGDLLFQVVFHAQMAREQGAFDFDAVVNAICDKMERRHPHVFGDATIDNGRGTNRRLGGTEAARTSGEATAAFSPTCRSACPR